MSSTIWERKEDRLRNSNIHHIQIPITIPWDAPVSEKPFCNLIDISYAVEVTFSVYYEVYRYCETKQVTFSADCWLRFFLFYRHCKFWYFHWQYSFDTNPTVFWTSAWFTAFTWPRGSIGSTETKDNNAATSSRRTVWCSRVDTCQPYCGRA